MYIYIIYIYILSNQTTKQVHHRSTMIFCVVVGLSDMGHFRDHLILNSKVGTSEALKVGTVEESELGSNHLPGGKLTVGP